LITPCQIPEDPDLSDEYSSEEEEEPDFDLPDWASFVVLGYPITQNEIVNLWIHALDDEEREKTLASLNYPDPKVRAMRLNTIELAFRVHLQETCGIRTATYSFHHPGAPKPIKFVAFCSTEPPNVIEEWFKVKNVRPGKNLDKLLKVGGMLGHIDDDGNVKEPTWIIPDQACSYEAYMRESQSPSSSYI
jgi:hypothetical protein